MTNPLLHIRGLHAIVEGEMVSGEPEIVIDEHRSVLREHIARYPTGAHRPGGMADWSPGESWPDETLPFLAGRKETA